MDKTEYKKLLTHPLWKAKRLEILERDDHKCTMCGRTNYLQVHHKFYEPILPWEYKNEDLITICNGCHKEWHKQHGNVYRSYIKKLKTNRQIVTDEDIEYTGDEISTYTSSKKIIDSIDITDQDDIRFQKAIDILLIDIADTLSIQKDGNIKINTKVVGDIMIDIDIKISYKVPKPIISTSKRKRKLLLN